MRKLLEEHRDSNNPLPLIGGHRGCACSYTENTIKAMEEGLREGASYLEIDIQLTSDGIPIVFHDTRLEYKTPLHGYVHEHSYREIKEHWAVETLEDVMRWGKKANASFALELKCEPAFTEKANIALLHPMVEIVKDTQMSDNVEAFGIDYKVLKELKRIDKSFNIGLIVPAVHADPIALMKEYDAMIYLSYAFMSSMETVKKLQEHGYFVSGAILKDEEYIKHACLTHMDMFEHDEPAKARDFMSKLELR